MALFKLSRHRRYVSDEEYYAWFELAYTTVDVCAAGLFVAGSIMFLSTEWLTAKHLVLSGRFALFRTEADTSHHPGTPLRQE